MTYDPLCRSCRRRPVMDRCRICEECWYASSDQPQTDNGWQRAANRALAFGDNKLALSLIREGERY